MNISLKEFLENEVKRLETQIQSDMSEMLELPVNRDTEQLTLKIRIKLFREEKEHFEKLLAEEVARQPKVEKPVKQKDKSDSTVCSSCGAHIAIGAKFCTSCGTPIVARCSQCGAELKAGAKFCTSCGVPAGTTVSAPRGQNTSMYSESLTKTDDIFARFSKNSKASVTTESTSASNNSLWIAKIDDNDDDKYGFVDEKGKWMIQPIFDVDHEADELSFYFPKGCKYALAGQYYGGYSEVWYGIIDRKGNFVVGPIFDWVWMEGYDCADKAKRYEFTELGIRFRKGERDRFDLKDSNVLEDLKEFAQEQIDHRKFQPWLYDELPAEFRPDDDDNDDDDD